MSNWSQATSRRSLIAAGVAGAAGLIAQALGRPAAALANDPNDLALGVTNTTAGDTRLVKSVDGGVALTIQAFGSGAGLNSSSPDGIGVFGGSSTGFGLAGGTETGTGVFGWAGSHGRTAPRRMGVAVHGYAGYPTLAGAEDPTTRGVLGEATAGRAVEGIATSGIGVHGVSGSGRGVVAGVTGPGLALEVDGPLRFSTAGLGTVPIGSNLGVVHPPALLNSRSKILVTLMSDPGTARVRYVKVNGGNQFSVIMTGPVTHAVRFAWFVLS